MKVYLALSLAFVCLVRGDDVHHLRGDAQKRTATEMPVPANDEVGAVGKEPSQKQEVAETPKGTENEASPTPAEEVAAVAKEPETNGNDKLPTQENAKGTEHEAQVENGRKLVSLPKNLPPKTQQQSHKAPLLVLEFMNLMKRQCMHCTIQRRKSGVMTMDLMRTSQNGTTVLSGILMTMTILTPKTLRSQLV